MIDTMYLGSSPAEESCVQTTDPDYEVKALDECNRYKEFLLKSYKDAHGHDCPCHVYVKHQPHDFGVYYEVVARYDDNDRQQIAAAFWLESEAPTKWK